MTAQPDTEATTPEELAREAERFFAAHAPLRTPTTAGFGHGSDDVVGVGFAAGEEEIAEVAQAREWQAALYDAGLAWVAGPVEYGGRGLSAAHAEAVRTVARRYDLPSTGPLLVSHDIVAPAILVHGTPEQKARWLPRIWRGEVLCCQLFSEPEAGSDLASLRTQARRTDDGWEVTGQKVWSSGAHYAQLGELLARTGTPAERGRGITAFLVEMDDPGIEVRPLRQLTGSDHFNEVFLDGVHLAETDRLGPVGGGWRVAQTTLGGERSLLSDEDAPILREPVRRLFELAEHLGVAGDHAVQDLLGEAWLREQALLVTGERLRRGGAVPASVAKLQMTDNMQFFADVAGRLLGDRMAVDLGDWGTYVWSQLNLAAPAHRIAGGSDEIQRNIIAEQVLGLPRDPRPTAAEAS